MNVLTKTLTVQEIVDLCNSLLPEVNKERERIHAARTAGMEKPERFEPLQAEVDPPGDFAGLVVTFASDPAFRVYEALINVTTLPRSLYRQLVIEAANGVVTAQSTLHEYYRAIRQCVKRVEGDPAFNWGAGASVSDVKTVLEGDGELADFLDYIAGVLAVLYQRQFIAKKVAARLKSA